MADLTTRAGVETLFSPNGAVARVLNEELASLKQRIASNIISEGANASGKTIDSMSVSVDAGDAFGEVTGELTARSFFGALETGAKPWRTQYKRPPAFFVDIIDDWISAKGLDLSPYAVATNIMRRGTKLFQEGGRDTIYSKEIPKTVDAINARLVGLWSNVLTENIKLNSK